LLHAGLDVGLDSGLAVQGSFDGGNEVRVQVPLWARTSYIIRDESGDLEGGPELSFGPLVGSESPRYVLGLTLNTEKKVRELYLHEFLLLHAGGMYEVSAPNRWGLTGGMPFRFWASRQWSWRLTVAFTWLFENSRGPSAGMLYVTIGPSFMPGGRGKR
jgi:hypothetical protein